jgi:hypothetical protein
LIYSNFQGGYNLESVAECTKACVETLLGYPVPRINKSQQVSEDARQVVDQVTAILTPYWQFFGKRNITLRKPFEKGACVPLRGIFLIS